MTLFSAGVLFCAKPNKDGLVRREYKVVICTTLFISIVCVVICMINPATILITECPKFDSSHHHPPHHGGHQQHHYETISPYNPNTLDVLVRYNRYEEGGDGVDTEMTEHVLLLKYNLTDKHIEHKLWEEPKKSWLSTVSRVHQQSLDPVCSTQHYSRFHFLEAEIEEELKDRRVRLENTKSIRITSHDTLNGQTTPEEDQFDLHRWVRRICKNEVGFTIAYLVFMGVLIVLEFVTLVWYAFVVKDVAALAAGGDGKTGRTTPIKQNVLGARGA